MAKSKVNSIETLASQDSIDIEISHEEFDTILKEKNKYKKKEREFEKWKWKTRNCEIKQCKIKDLKNCKWWIIYATNYFSWSKNKIFFCVCIKWL